MTVDIPVYNARSRSIKQDMLRRMLGSRFVKGGYDRFDVRALHAIDLDLRDGDRLAILGHNGAGKTTLLRVLGGILPPSDGTIEIDGVISCMTDIGMGMDPEATGAENIVLRGVFMGLTFAEARALVPSVAEFSELGDYLNMPLRIYSTGMYLRLAFAVSTELRPEILMLDELIGAGDARFLERAWARLKAMFSSAKILALATHDMALAESMCNRAIVIQQGEIVAAGTPTEMVADYRRRVAAG